MSAPSSLIHQLDPSPPGKHEQAQARVQRAIRPPAAWRSSKTDRMHCEIPAAVPTHADSLYMLGVLALRAGLPRIALPHIEQAIAAQPRETSHNLTLLLSSGIVEQQQYPRYQTKPPAPNVGETPPWMT